MPPISFSRHTLLASILLVFSTGTACATTNEVKLAETELQKLVVKHASARIEGPKEIVWSYAYFVGPKTRRLDRLNGWLRAQSIERLFQDQELTDQALKSKDSAIIQRLKSDETSQVAASESAWLSPLRIFGKYLLLSASNTYTSDRQYSFSEVLIYDFEMGEPIALKSLFLDGAEGDLNDLLAKSIRKNLLAGKRSYNKCLKERAAGSKVTCGGNGINIEQCIESTQINWSNLEIINSRHLRLEFPYRPWTYEACNYEFGFDIRGPEVENLLVTPAVFRKGREFHKAE